MTLIKYNYCCLEGSCSNNSLQIVEKEEILQEKTELCIDCSKSMKRIGRKAPCFTASKEVQYQKMQNEIRQKAKTHDKNPDIQKLKQKRAKEEIKNVQK